MTDWFMTFSRLAVWTSTTGVSPVTVPVRVACANTVAGSSRRTRIARHFVRLRIPNLSVIGCGQAVRPVCRTGEEYRPVASASRTYETFCYRRARKSKDLYTEVRKGVSGPLTGDVDER